MIICRRVSVRSFAHIHNEDRLLGNHVITSDHGSQNVRPEDDALLHRDSRQLPRTPHNCNHLQPFISLYYSEKGRHLDLKTRHHVFLGEVYLRDFGSYQISSVPFDFLLGFCRVLVHPPSPRAIYQRAPIPHCVWREK